MILLYIGRLINHLYRGSVGDKIKLNRQVLDRNLLHWELRLNGLNLYATSWELLGLSFISFKLQLFGGRHWLVSMQYAVCPSTWWWQCYSIRVLLIFPQQCHARSWATTTSLRPQNFERIATWWRHSQGNLSWPWDNTSSTCHGTTQALAYMSRNSMDMRNHEGIFL